MIESFSGEKASSALYAAVRDTFADMAFLDVCPSAETAPLRAGGGSWASIDFLKPLSTKILCWFPAGLADRIVESLRPDGEGERLDREDFLLEFLNVIAGNFLTNYFGWSFASKLQLPQILTTCGDSEGKPLVALDLDAEGLRFRVELGPARRRY